MSDEKFEPLEFINAIRFCVGLSPIPPTGKKREPEIKSSKDDDESFLDFNVIKQLQIDE